MVAGHIQFSTEGLLCITKPRKLARKLFHLHSRRLTKHSLALPRVLFCIKQKGDPPKGSPFVLSGNYSMTATAPASFMRATIFSASSLLTPSLIMPRSSTSFFASARPREVNSRTALMTSIFFAPISLSLTLNSVFSSSAGAAAAAGAAATATGFQSLHELVELDDRHTFDLFDELSDICHFRDPPNYFLDWIFRPVLRRGGEAAAHAAHTEEPLPLFRLTRPFSLRSR